jgi:anti-sigma regulatory factor (Ser/Thr protein kinase)
LLDVRTFVGEACERADVPRADRLRLMLVVEELFVNTVTHGHGRDTDAPVHLALTVTPSAIAVDYRDTARAFDPFAAREASLDADPAEDSRVGGLGIRLITAMAEDVGYVRDDGWNRITFRVTRSG